MKQRKIEIVIRTRERVIIKSNLPARQFFCAFCGAETMVIPPERAAAVFNLSAREIYRRVENGAGHFIETDNGLTLVCSASFSTDEPKTLKPGTFLQF